MPDTPTRPRSGRPSVYVVGIGGPTCSDKTTLAKHLGRIIPDSNLLFQDDFAPPSEKVPMHPTQAFQDWDDPDGAIEWDRQREAIRHLRQLGEIPLEHSSHDHLNEQIPVPIEDEIEREWKDKFRTLFADIEKENRERPSVLLSTSIEA